MPTTWYVDQINGNDSNDGLSYVNRKKTLSAITTSIAGDTIRVMETAAAYSLGQSGTFNLQATTVALTSALTTTISDCDSAWTASTNVTCTTTTTRKQGTNAASIAIATAFTTGKAAFFATGLLDLSAYQQVSFALNASIAVASGVVRVDLCSDTSGNTPVNSMTISLPLGIGWNIITLDNGSALGSSIQSIALTMVSDPGAVTLIIDNVQACLAPNDPSCLTLNHVIGASDGRLFGIRSISGTVITLETLDASSTLASGSNRGFWSETAAANGTNPFTDTVYVRLPAPIVRNTNGYAMLTYLGGAGSAGNPVTISGGWDTASMSVQSGDTLYDAVSSANVAYLIGTTTGTAGGSANYVDWSKFGIVRGINNVNISTATTNNNLTDIIVIANHGFVFPALSAGSQFTFTRCKFWGGSIVQINVTSQDTQMFDCEIISQSLSSISMGGGQTTARGLIIDGLLIANNLSSFSYSAFQNEAYVGNISLQNCGGGITSTAGGGIPIELYGITVQNCSGSPLSASNGTLRVYGLTTSGNTSGVTISSTAARLILCDDNIAESPDVVGMSANFQGVIQRHRVGGDKTNNQIIQGKGIIKSQTSVVPPGMSVAWAYNPNNGTNGATVASEALGRNTPIAIEPVKGGATNTFQFACYRDSANLNCRLRVRGGRYPGIGSIGTDVITTVNPAINTWTNYSIAVTPSEDCVIEIFFECWRTDGVNTYNAYIGGPVVVT